MTTDADRYLDDLTRELDSADLSRIQRDELLANMRELLDTGLHPAAIGSPRETVADFLESTRAENREASEGAANMWDPASDRLLVAKTHGMGENIAWGGVAVRLGLIRPDDVDDDVLAAIPAPAMAAVRCLPTALAGAVAIASATMRRRRLRFPLRISLRGRVKRSLPPGPGALLATVGSLAVGLGALRPTTGRMDALTRSATACALNASILGQTLLSLTQRDGRVKPHLHFGFAAASVAVEGAVLLLATKAGLKRVGREPGPSVAEPPTAAPPGQPGEGSAREDRP